jgi:monodehydroascorbate reductase (NADH)
MYGNASFAVARLFTPKIAEFYENYYMSKGVTFIKGTAVTSLEVSAGKVSFNMILQ